MKNTMEKRFIITGIFFLFISACGPSIYEAKKAYELAERNYVAAENLAKVEQEQYENDIKMSAKELNNAEIKLQKGATSESYESSSTSLEISQMIMIDIYKKRIGPLALKLKQRINTIKDEDNPLKSPEIMEKLNNIIEHSKKIPDKPVYIKGEPLNEQKVDKIMLLANAVIKDFTDVAKIKKMADTVEIKTLESDVSFEIGEYQLSKKGKKALDSFIGKIIRNIKDKTAIIRIKAIGYTDKVGFNESKSLFKKLVKGYEDKIPTKQPERRKFLNKRLSKLRSQVIGNYVRSRILQFERRGQEIKVETETIGRGEQHPFNLPPPYPKLDPRRRICKIYIHQKTW